MSEAIQSRLSEALADRYRVEREIGEGGMANVFLATDLKHDRSVAIKVLKPDLSAVVGAERFLAEIATTAKLQHPHILPLFDSGETDGLLYYVMPFVEGESLRDRLVRERQLPVEDAIKIAIDVAGALEYAHRNGVVHRDIKPENILLVEDRPTVADFGVALAVEQSGGARLTATGLSVGTPQYMSPEQASGDQRVGPLSDTYSLAALLYEMLAGRPPFEAVGVPALVAKILTSDAAAVTEHRATVPAHVAGALRRALERVPADRFTSAQSFADALGDSSFRYDPVAADGPGGAPSSLWNPLSITMTALVVLLLGGLIGRAVTGGGTAEEARRFVLGLGSSNVHAPDYASSVAFSPDGQTLVYAGAEADGRWVLWTRRTGDLDATRLEGIEEPSQAFFSPDGSELAVTGLAQLRIVSLDGALRVSDDSRGVQGLGGHWDSDGWIYLVTDAGIERYSPATSGWEMLAPHSGSNVPNRFPYPLPRSRGLLYSTVEDGVRVVVVRDPETGTVNTLGPGVRAEYLESGHLLVVRPDGTVMGAAFDLDALAPTGPWTRVLDGVAVGPRDGANFSIGASGDLAYSTSEAAAAFSLIWVDRDGESQPLDPGWTGVFEGVALSPDQETLAVTVGDERESAIWLKELDGSPLRRLTFAEGSNRRPVWTRDGGSIVFISDRSGARSPFLRDADGTGSAQPFLTYEANVDQVALGSAEWVAFRIGRMGEERDILARRMGPDTATVAIAAEPGVDEVGPSLSPSGRFVAYTSSETGRDEIWVRTFPDPSRGRWQVSTEGGSEAKWSNDGREIFFRSATTMNVAAVETDPTFRLVDIEELFPTSGTFASGVDWSYDVTNDGQRFVLIQFATALRELVIVEDFQAAAVQLIESSR